MRHCMIAAALILTVTVLAATWLCPSANAQQVSIDPTAPAGQCLVVDTLWISFDATLQNVEAAYFSLSYDSSHFIPMGIIKAPSFDSSVFLGATIFPSDSMSINIGFLVGSFSGPGQVVGIVYAPGVSISSSTVDFMASVLRDTANADIPHSTAIGAVVTTTCCCRFQGDLDSSGTFDIIDVVSLVEYIFRAGPVPFQDAGCPEHRGEITCDQTPNVIDIIELIEVTFRGGDPDFHICNPCNCDPYPTGCP